MFGAAAQGHMAQNKKPALSKGFDAARLDAIGRWVIVPDPDELWIQWSRPAALQGGWVPVDLEFRTSFDEFDPFEPLPAEYDPDERMFELLGRLLATKEQSFQQLRAVVAEAERTLGATTGATVTVDRYLNPDEDMCHCELRVSF